MKKKETPEKKKKEPIYQNKTTLTVYLVLRTLVIFVLVARRSAVTLRAYLCAV